MFYIYFHINKESGEIFYVGKGSGKRAYVKSHRSIYWKRIVAKYGYEIVIKEDFLTEKESAEREIYWISLIGRKDLGNGSLINFTDGGEGTTGRLVDEKTRLAVALSNATRPKSKVQSSIVGSRYKGKFGSQHNRSKSVRCIETGAVYGSQSEAQRVLNLGGGSISWAVKHGKPIYGMHYEIGG